MSFDFNVLSSSDDERSDNEDVVNSIGGHWKDNHNTTAAASTITAPLGSTNLAVEDSDAESADAQNNADFGFDGYDDYYDFDEDDRKPSSMDSSSNPGMAFPSDFDAVGEGENNKDKDEDEDEDEIDWEDAEEDAPDDIPETAKSVTLTPKAVTIDLGSNVSKQSKSKPKRTKRTRSVAVFQHDKLAGNPGLQSLLGDLHKASLLAWASHAYGVSAQVSKDSNLGLAHSLIPTAWWGTASSIPTEEDVGHFVHWFTNYVGREPSNHHSTNTRRSYARTGKRLRTSTSFKNAKKKRGSSFDPMDNDAKHHDCTSYRIAEYCEHLAKVHRDINHSTDDNEDPFHDTERLLLFLSMVRSLGWRARYLVAIEPISRDLDVDHPLFQNDGGAKSNAKTNTVSFGNNSSILARFFGKVLSWGHGTKETPITMDDENDSKPCAKSPMTIHGQDSKPPAKQPSHTETIPASLYSSNGDANINTLEKHRQHLCWAEILCKSRPRDSCSKTSSSSTLQWMHVDPIVGITNQPNSVEERLLEREKQRNTHRTNGNRNKLAISYALAVEHFHPPETPMVVRMTDVTRRYASSMVATMKARGIVQNPCSKPKRRKTKRAMMMKREKPRAKDRPDEWFSKFLAVMNHRPKTSATKTQKKPKPTRQELKWKGNSTEDAIALDDDDDSDLDKKPAAKDMTTDNRPQSDSLDYHEESQLQESAEKEPLPTSKAAFKKSPVYVIRSVLNSTQVLKPEAKSHVCGMFKGELVFRRRDVETALSAKRWLYEGRKVQDSQLGTPILTKARKRPSKGQFQALTTYGVGVGNDGSEASRLSQLQQASETPSKGTESLYGSWQTDPWEPPAVGPGDPLPVNEHNNIELELLNPGLVHIQLYRVAKVAKKLGLPYAPCMMGFEGSGKPTVRGIVVHETNEVLLREAHAAMHDHLLQEEHEKRETAILLRWKRILVGVLTKDRLEREYGSDDTIEEEIEIDDNADDDGQHES